MLSDDELRAAAEKALKLGIECARDRTKANILANLSGTAASATTPKIAIVPQELPFTLHPRRDCRLSGHRWI